MERLYKGSRGFLIFNAGVLFRDFYNYLYHDHGRDCVHSRSLGGFAA
jgi:hypothetical protein